MTAKIIYPDGTECPAGICIGPDHHVSTFTVTVRTLHGMSPTALKDLLQTRVEVTHIDHTQETIVCGNAKP